MLGITLLGLPALWHSLWPYATPHDHMLDSLREAMFFGLVCSFFDQAAAHCSLVALGETLGEPHVESAVETDFDIGTLHSG